MNIMREDYNDNHIFFELNESSNINDLFKKYNEMKSLNIQKQSIDFLYFELNNKIYLNTNKYIYGLIIFLQLVLSYQKENGVTIIKIDNIFYKPIIDILYILTSLYDKIYIVKPNTTNIITNERYLVCKNFTVKKNEALVNKLEQLIKTSSKKILLIVDNLRVHHSKIVKEWVEQNKEKIELFYLPSYSPERNPDEYLNCDLKQGLSNIKAPRNKEILEQNMKNHMEMLSENPNRVKSYFKHEDIKYAA